MKILVVDDHKDSDTNYKQAFKTILDIQDNEILFRRNLDEAIDDFDEIKPDIVVVDLNLRLGYNNEMEGTPEHTLKKIADLKQATIDSDVDIICYTYKADSGKKDIKEELIKCGVKGIVQGGVGTVNIHDQSDLNDACYVNYFDRLALLVGYIKNEPVFCKSCGQQKKRFQIKAKSHDIIGTLTCPNDKNHDYTDVLAKLENELFSKEKLVIV